MAWLLPKHAARYHRTILTQALTCPKPLKHTMYVCGSRSTLACPNMRNFKDLEAVFFGTLSSLLSLVGPEQLKRGGTEPLYLADGVPGAASQSDKAGTSQIFPDNDSSNAEPESRVLEFPEKVGTHLIFSQSVWHLQKTTPTFFPHELLHSIIGPYQQQCIITWHSQLICNYCRRWRINLQSPSIPLGLSHPLQAQLTL